MILEMLDDYPRLLPARDDLVILPPGQEFQNEPRSTRVSGIAHNPGILRITRNFFRGLSTPPHILETQNAVKLRLLVFEMVSLVFVEG